MWECKRGCRWLQSVNDKLGHVVMVEPERWESQTSRKRGLLCRIPNYCRTSPTPPTSLHIALKRKLLCALQRAWQELYFELIFTEIGQFLIELHPFLLFTSNKHRQTSSKSTAWASKNTSTPKVGQAVGLAAGHDVGPLGGQLECLYGPVGPS